MDEQKIFLDQIKQKILMLEREKEILDAQNNNLEEELNITRKALENNIIKETKLQREIDSSSSSIKTLLEKNEQLENENKNSNLLIKKEFEDKKEKDEKIIKLSNEREELINKNNDLMNKINAVKKELQTVGKNSSSLNIDDLISKEIDEEKKYSDISSYSNFGNIPLDDSEIVNSSNSNSILLDDNIDESFKIENLRKELDKKEKYLEHLEQNKAVQNLEHKIEEKNSKIQELEYKTMIDNRKDFNLNKIREEDPLSKYNNISETNEIKSYDLNKIKQENLKDLDYNEDNNSKSYESLFKHFIDEEKEKNNSNENIANDYNYDLDNKIEEKDPYIKELEDKVEYLDGLLKEREEDLEVSKKAFYNDEISFENLQEKERKIKELERLLEANQNSQVTLNNKMQNQHIVEEKIKELWESARLKEQRVSELTQALNEKDYMIHQLQQEIQDSSDVQKIENLKKQRDSLLDLKRDVYEKFNNIDFDNVTIKDLAWLRRTPLWKENGNNIDIYSRLLNVILIVIIIIFVIIQVIIII